MRCLYTEFNDMVNRLTHTVNMNVDAMKADRATWAEQFRNALNVNGGDVDNASNFDYAMHFLTFFWKVRPCAARVYHFRGPCPCSPMVKPLGRHVQ